MPLFSIKWITILLLGCASVYCVEPAKEAAGQKGGRLCRELLALLNTPIDVLAQSASKKTAEQIIGGELSAEGWLSKRQTTAQENLLVYREDLIPTFTDMQDRTKQAVSYMEKENFPEPAIAFGRELSKQLERILADKSQTNYENFLKLMFPFTRAVELVDGHKEFLKLGKLVKSEGAFERTVIRGHYPPSLIIYSEVVSALKARKNTPWLSLEPNKKNSDDFHSRFSLEARTIDLLRSIAHLGQLRVSFKTQSRVRLVGAAGSPIYLGSFIDQSLTHDNQTYSPYGFLVHDFTHLERLIERDLSFLLGKGVDIQSFYFDDTLSHSKFIKKLESTMKIINSVSDVEMKKKIQYKIDRNKDMLDHLAKTLDFKTFLAATDLIYLANHENYRELFGNDSVDGITPPEFFTSQTMTSPTASETQDTPERLGLTPYTVENLQNASKAIRDYLSRQKERRKPQGVLREPLEKNLRA